MNRSLQVSCLITSMLLAVNTARADGIDVVNIPAGEDKIVPIHKGEFAPIDGQIFDNETALRWANWLVQYKQIAKTNAVLQQKLCSIEVNAANEKVKVEQEKSSKIIPDLETRLAKANDEVQNPPFYRTVWFGATLGATLTSIAAIAVVISVHK